MCALAVLAMVFAVPGVTNNSEAAFADDDIMNIGITQTPDTLNVYKMTLAIGWTINFLVYDTLNSIDEKLKPGPQLADSWETDESGLVWTFHINETAYWHDGEKVTADDVAFSYNLIMDNPSACALWIDYLTGVVNPVEVVDTYTVRITTEEPKATMLSALIPIVPEHLWSAVPTNMINKVDPWDPTYFPEGPVGSGPLILDEYEATLGWIRMLKNPDYFIDTVKVDEVLFNIYDAPEAMTTALQSGEIDVAMDVPAKVWDEVLEYDGIDGQAGKSLSVFELGINCASEDLRTSFPKASENLETTNLSVRRAIAMATEKDYIVEDVMAGLADVGDSIIPTATDYWHWFTPEEKRWDYDLDRANATLDAAGYTWNAAHTVRENSTSGVDLEFSFYYMTTSPGVRVAAVRISAALAKIGIVAEPDGVSEGVMYNLWLGCEMDLFIWAWDTDVDPNFMLSTQTTSQIPLDPQDWTKWSDSFWSNETYDALYLEQQFTVDLEARKDIVHEMQALLYDQCPYVVLYYPLGLYAYNIEKFTNYPDWVTNPGMTPGTMWFFFEVTPSEDWVDPMPPENVYAGADQSCVEGETLWFTGSATDPNDLEETLNWTWTFMEPDEITESTRWGKTVSYKFDQIGEVGVMLVVTDPGGHSGVDDLTVTVSEMSEDMGILMGRVVDQDSEPIVGATVTALNYTKSTDPNGNYSMTIDAGEYVVNATKSGYMMDSVDAVVVAGETTWANLTLTLTSGTLVVRVLDSETGEAIASALVNATYGSFSIEYVTQPTGNATFPGVDVGTVEVVVSKSGYEDNSTEATVTAGETTVVVVELTPEPEEDSNTLLIALAVIGILAVVAIAAVVLMKKRKAGQGGEDPPPPDEPSP